jgi:hypothetical protein
VISQLLTRQRKCAAAPTEPRLWRENTNHWRALARLHFSVGLTVAVHPEIADIPSFCGMTFHVWVAGPCAHGRYKLLASVTAFCLLSGCAGSVIGDALNPEGVAEREDGYCTSIGLQFGTPNMRPAA